MKKLSVLILFTLLAGLVPLNVVHAHSRDSISEVAVDGLYGGLAGALIGAATLAFVDKPSLHEDNIKVGVGVGIILGSAYGSIKLSRSLTYLEDGKMMAQFPTIELIPDASIKRGALLWNIKLFQTAF